MSAIDLSVVHPYDPSAPGASGFDSFLRGLAKELPREWALEVVGVSRNRASRPLGCETLVEVAGRPVSFVPVLYDAEPGKVRRIPLSLRFAAACRAARSVEPRGRIVQYQRFESILACPPPEGRRTTCFLHNHPPELAGAASDVRWRGLGKAMRYVLGRALARVDAVWAVDPRTPGWLASTYPALEPARPLAVWADPEIFRAAPADRAADRGWLRSVLSLEPDSKVCLFAGRVESQKDLPMLMRGWARLAERQPQVRLAIVGEGRAAPAVRRLAERLGVGDRVRWSGFLPQGELARCYRGADCVVCASSYESGPRLVVEALACGTPAVTFALGQAPEMLEPLEDLGLIAGDRSPEALAASLERALDLPRGQELEARCSAAAAPFTPGRALAPVLEVYRRWLGSPAPG